MGAGGRHSVLGSPSRARPQADRGLEATLVLAVNDRYGHAGGDAVLHEFAIRLHSILRAEDTGARWGGEEFLVILPDTDGFDAAALAERVRKSVEAEPFPAGSELTCDLTISCGCATSGARIRRSWSAASTTRVWHDLHEEPPGRHAGLELQHRCPRRVVAG